MALNASITGTTLHKVASRGLYNSEQLHAVHVYLPEVWGSSTRMYKDVYQLLPTPNEGEATNGISTTQMLFRVKYSSDENKYYIGAYAGNEKNPSNIDVVSDTSFQYSNVAVYAPGQLVCFGMCFFNKVVSTRYPRYYVFAGSEKEGSRWEYVSREFLGLYSCGVTNNYKLSSNFRLAITGLDVLTFGQYSNASEDVGLHYMDLYLTDNHQYYRGCSAGKLNDFSRYVTGSITGQNYTPECVVRLSAEERPLFDGEKYGCWPHKHGVDSVQTEYNDLLQEFNGTYTASAMRPESEVKT